MGLRDAQEDETNTLKRESWTSLPFKIRFPYLYIYDLMKITKGDADINVVILDTTD